MSKRTTGKTAQMQNAVPGWLPFWTTILGGFLLQVLCLPTNGGVN